MIVGEHIHLKRFSFPDFEQSSEGTAGVTSFVLWFCFLLWYMYIAEFNILIIFVGHDGTREVATPSCVSSGPRTASILVRSANFFV